MSSFVTGFNVKLPQEPENLKEEPMDAGVAVGWAAAPPPPPASQQRSHRLKAEIPSPVPFQFLLCFPEVITMISLLNSHLYFYICSNSQCRVLFYLYVVFFHRWCVFCSWNFFTPQVLIPPTLKECWWSLVPAGFGVTPELKQCSPEWVSPYEPRGLGIYGSPSYPQSKHSKTPSGCLKRQIVPDLVYTMFFPIHTYLW